MKHYGKCIITTEYSQGILHRERLDEVLSHEIQTGSETLMNDGYDIVFDHVGFKYDDNTDVLKDGMVAEQGSPEFLSGYESIYKRMTARQLISQNWKM